MIFYDCEELEAKLYKAGIINMILSVLLCISLLFNLHCAMAESINCTTFGTLTTCTNGMTINRMALGTNITTPEPVLPPMEQIAPAMLVAPFPQMPQIPQIQPIPGFNK
jgi:hypothetical protein